MYRAKYFPDLFARYEKIGRDWIKALSPEDMQLFVRLGFQCSGYGIEGGRARARTARRDRRGRFLPDKD